MAPDTYTRPSISRTGARITGHGLLHLVTVVAALMAVAFACGDSAEEAKRPEPLAPGDNLMVGAIHVGSINDNGYNQAMHEGLLQMKSSIPNIEIIEAENVPETSDSEIVMEDMIDRGAKLIFPMSFGYLDHVLAVASKHPNVIFEHPAGGKLAPNVGTFWSDTTSMEYLMGIVAGKSTKTNKLGWVIGFPVPNILTSINAFQLGAQSVNPEVTTEVIVNNAWLDPAQEAAAINALADAGVDVVTMIVDSPTTVVSTAAHRGINSIGFHCICVQNSAGQSWLTGIGFTWGDLFTQIARDVMAGTWESVNKVGAIDHGYAAIAPYGPEVSDETKTLVEQARAAIISGQLDPFAGPIFDNQGNVRVKDGEIGDPYELLVSTDYLVAGVSRIK